MAALSIKKKIAAGAATGCILVGGGVTGAIVAGGPSTAAAASPAAPAAHRRAPHNRARGMRRILARADHATIEMRQRRSWVTLTINKGRVTAVSASSLALLRPDGQSVNVALGTTTHFRGAAVSSATITIGRSAVVISEGGTARTVIELKLRSGHHKSAEASHVSPTPQKASTPSA